MAELSGFTRNDVQEILKIIDQLGDVEVQLEMGDVKLFVKKGAPGGAVRAVQAGTTAEVETVPRLAATAPAQTPAAAPVVAAPAAAATSASAPASANAKEVPAGMVAIRSPLLGRFFVASSPNDPPFVQIGQQVEEDDSVAVLEVMKLFNTIQAGVKGKIVEIRAANGEMVEFDQILFIVEPQ